MPTHHSKQHIGYWQLLKNNPQVRRLWFAQVVSELGDWLNFVALVQLIKHFTPNAQAVGGLIVVQMLPMVVMGPVAGIVADRFNRATGHAQVGGMFEDDRAKLSAELDAARGRERELAQAGEQASQALGRAIAEIRAALANDQPEKGAA